MASQPRHRWRRSWLLDVFVDIATALVMRRFRVSHDASEPPAFLSISFNDITAFAIVFGLAVWWRNWPEFHRRLMLFATSVLTGAAFARFALSIMHNPWWWDPGVGLLILLAVAYDLIVIRRIHPVYSYGLPLLMIGHWGAVYPFLPPPHHGWQSAIS